MSIEQNIGESGTRIVTPRRKRQRITNPLEMNNRDFRHLKDKDKDYNCYLNGSKSKNVVSSEQLAIMAARSQNNFRSEIDGEVTRTTSSSSLMSPQNNMTFVSASDVVCPLRPDEKRVKGFYSCRDQSIRYLFILFGSPGVEDWDDCNIVQLISNILNIPQNSYRSVTKVLNRIIENGVENEYDPNLLRKQNSGRNALIIDGDSSAYIVYKSVESGMTDTMITYIVNKHRESIGEGVVSRSTVYNFIRNSKIIVTSKRESTKQGSSDKESDWAKGR